jgi:hypothetical protein
MAFRVGRERVAFVDGFTFPVGVRGRFAAVRPGLTEAQLGVVEAAARQWFRLFARHPRGARSLPSVLVTDWWREFIRHEREYADFTASAVGRPLPFAESTGSAVGRPLPFAESTGSAVGRPLPFAESTASGVAPAGRALAVTYRQAQADEPGGLPLLFRVDKELNVADGRHYVPDCGGRGQCWPVPGATCLQHLDGVGSGPVGRGRFRRPPPPAEYAGGGDVGGL